MRMTVFALLLAATALTGCEAASECQRSPPMKTEQRPKPPVSEDEQIWQPGSWDWNGTGYTWREGRWIKRAQAGGSNLWMDGYWTRDQVPGPCYWVPAHWVP
jgi:hypothetical protein